jgi:mRNA-degrading endonuclease RelE of RelBE toxin-antitoxin system
LRQKLESLKPLKGRNDRRSARVGGLRILFEAQGLDIIVAEIGPRGEIYKHGL